MTDKNPPARKSAPPIDHVQAQEWISAYLDGELPAPSARALRAHLDECPDCRGEVETLRRAIVEVSGLRSMPPEPRESLLPSIQMAIRRRSRGKFFADGYSIGGYRYPALWVALAMLALVLAYMLLAGGVKDVAPDRGAPAAIPAEPDSRR